MRLIQLGPPRFLFITHLTVPYDIAPQSLANATAITLFLLIKLNSPPLDSPLDENKMGTSGTWDRGMGGPSERAVRLRQRMEIEAAERMSKEAAAIVVENWNARLKEDGPVRPSPTLALLRYPGYRWMQISCDGCETSSWIDCETIKRKGDIEIANLMRSLKCKRCNRQGPLPRIEGLLRTRLPDMRMK